MTTSSQVNNSKYLKFAFYSMAIAVLFGALAAHVLKTFLPPVKIESFQTAVRYQMIHSIAIILVVLLQKHGFEISKWSYRLFQWGIFLFCGSIYLLSTTLIHGFEAIRFIGPITPIGGLLFIAAWVLTARSIANK